MYVTRDLTDSTALIHNSMIDYLSHSSHNYVQNLSKVLLPCTAIVSQDAGSLHG